MKSPGRVTRQFLLAARRSEIASLRQLVASCELVTAISLLIHELQRERGIANVWLGSGGHRFHDECVAQSARAVAAARTVHGVLERLGTTPLPGLDSARLFAAIAAVLQELDGLETLRRRIVRRDTSPGHVRETYTRLIAGLLTVVFEAADIACELDLACLLVALFNVMQGKELAGQERALAAAALAAGRLDAADRERLRQRVAAQEHCFALAAEVVPEVVPPDWSRPAPGALAEDEFLRLRKVLAKLTPEDAVPPALSEIWYALATRRIDRMKAVEELLAERLLDAAQRAIRRAEEELAGRPATLRPAPLPDTGDAPPLLVHPGPGPDRALRQLVRDQRDQLARMARELDEARNTLRERKWVERARDLLMARHGLSEDDAYRRLREIAMQTGRRLGDVAEELVRRSVPPRPRH